MLPAIRVVSVDAGNGLGSHLASTSSFYGWETEAEAKEGAFLTVNLVRGTRRTRTQDPAFISVFLSLLHFMVIFFRLIVLASTKMLSSDSFCFERVVFLSCLSKQASVFRRILKT